MSITTPPNPNHEIPALDRERRPIKAGDRIGFVMRGWFLPREQESFGVIKSIDERGGILIEVVDSYRHFSSSGRVAVREATVFFTHHEYDPVARARIYSKNVGPNQLYIFLVDPSQKSETPA